MTVEDRLRETLHRQAQATPLSGDGWARIDDRLRRRRRGRRVAAIAVAAALPAAAVAAFLVVDRNGSPGTVQVPVGTTALPPPAGDDERPTRTATISEDEDFPGIWPDTTEAETARAEPGRGDPAEVARAFAGARWGIAEPEMYPFEDLGGGEGQIGFDVPGHERPYGGHVRLVERSGVWVVREARLGHLTLYPVGALSLRGVESAGALRTPLVLEANTTVPGTGTVELRRLGDDGPPLAAEVLELDGRTPRRVVFRPELDRPGLHVVARVTDGEGRLHADEFRVNGLVAGRPDPHPAIEAGDCGGVPTDGPEADEALRSLFADPAGAGAPTTARFRPVLARRLADLATEGFSVDRFTVTGDWYRQPGVAAVCARVHLDRDGRLAAVRHDVFVVVREGEDWRVDRWYPGPREDIDATATVAVFFRDGVDCDGARLVEAAVEVPEGMATPETALLELLSGPAGRAPAATTALPADGRLHFAFEEDGVAVVELSDATDAGGGSCLQQARVEQIRRTLTAFPQIDDVQLEPAFQP